MTYEEFGQGLKEIKKKEEKEEQDNVELNLSEGSTNEEPQENIALEMPGNINPTPKPENSLAEIPADEIQEAIPVFEDRPTGFRFDIEKTREKNKKHAAKIIKNSFLFIFTLLIMVSLFVFGLLIGGEYGVKTDKINIREINVVSEFTELLKSVTALPVSLTVTEDKMNEMLQSQKEIFEPLKNLNISLEDDVCVFSGQMKTSEIKEYVDEEIPDFLFLFFPETLNIKAEFVPDEENPAEPKIKSISILNLDYSDDIINEIKPQTVFEDILKENFLSAVPSRLALQSFEIKKEKLICHGNLKIVE